MKQHKITMEFTISEEQVVDGTMAFIFNVAGYKVNNQLKRTASICMALEADDVVKDMNGNNIGTITVQTES